jgi:hypothetical protein
MRLSRVHYFQFLPLCPLNGLLPATLTWCLIELSRDQATQSKLREELLSKYPSSDPSYDDFNATSQNGLPLLDAVVHETLRLHPAVESTTRFVRYFFFSTCDFPLIPAIPLLRFQAAEDDIMPLSQPITTTDGKTINSLFIPKGTKIMVPIAGVNTMEEFWGPDSTKFNPERWFKVEESNARHIAGYRHLLTFIDGPKACIGKGFAVAEAKVCAFHQFWCPVFISFGSYLLFFFLLDADFNTLCFVSRLSFLF